MKDILKAVEVRSAERRALGTIVGELTRATVDGKEVVTDGRRIEYRTYREMFTDARRVGSYVISHALYRECPETKYRLVGIFSKNRAEWLTVDVACMLYNLTVVPFYDTLGDENISYVIEHCSLSTCFASAGALESLFKAKKLLTLKTIVCFDAVSPETVAKFKDRGVAIIPFSEVCSASVSVIDDTTFVVKPESCLTFSYTSGTTGPPKGAMLSHRNFASFCHAGSTMESVGVRSSDVIISYLPLPHILEREVALGMLSVGGTIVFYAGDINNLKYDITLVRPTIFVSVPRLFTRFYEAIKKNIEALPEGCKKSLVQKAVATKLANTEADGSYSHALYDVLVFPKMREALGGNVRLMISGSAPLLPEVHKFLKIAMCCPFLEGYGQTESTGACSLTARYEKFLGVVGSPTINAEIKLCDVPDMGYTARDRDEEGRATPRGEICVRGPVVFLGYYRDPEKTKEAIDPEGWLHTGDIGVILPEGFQLKIIDRKKNIFKLQQGEYVAAEKVEGIYLKSDWIS